MRISILQTDIVWENKQENLRRLPREVRNSSWNNGDCCFTGNILHRLQYGHRQLGRTHNGRNHRNTAPMVRRVPACSCRQLYCLRNSLGSRKPSYYNRAFFLTPEGNTYYYDKRHLFRMGHETEHFTSGNRRPIIRYRGWNILLLVCYDLRFPVWSRNTSNEYDLLIYVANWPIPRRKVWDILLQARALENISYVCGVNRIGKDGRDIPHSGGSVVYSPKGEVLATVPDNEEAIATASLNLSSLQEFRLKFPAWKDADEFVISSNNSSQ